MLVVLEHQVGRLEAEATGTVWRGPAKVERANMLGIRKSEAARTSKRQQALKAALLYFASLRQDPDYKALANRVAIELGEPFPWRNLYNAPYDTMWREAGDRAGDQDVDLSPLFKARARMSRRALVHHIRRMGAKRDRLLEERRAALLAVSEEGWEPIPDHRGETPPQDVPDFMVHF